MTGVRYIDLAPEYFAKGWHPLPLEAMSKWPPPTGFTGAEGRNVTVADIRRWSETFQRYDKTTKVTSNVPSVNLGLRVSANILGIDVDAYGDKNGASRFAELVARLGPLPPTWSSTSRGAGASRIYLYRIPEGVVFPGEVTGASIEFIQHHHRYLLAYPSTHPTGNQYRWYTPDGEVTEVVPSTDDLPDLPQSWIEAFDKRPKMSTVVDIPAARETAPIGVTSTHQQVSAVGPTTSNAVLNVVGRFHSEAPAARHPAMLKAVMALTRLESQGHPGAADELEGIRSAFIRMVTTTGDNIRTQEAAEQEWADAINGASTRLAAEPDTRPPWNQLMQPIDGYRLPAPVDTDVSTTTDDGDDLDTTNERVPVAGIDGFRYTDQGNAQRLIAQHGKHIRFVPMWERWMCYVHGRWHLDHADTMVSHLAADLGKTILTWENIKKAKQEPDDRKRRENLNRLISWGMRTENRTGVQGTLAAAATVPGLAIDHESIDAQPWLFNVKNGTINLETGELQPQTPGDLLMMQANVRYDPQAGAPEFEKFVAEILPDEEVRRFVQRLLGLALVGEQVEHILPIALGGGANGKSTLTKIVAAVFGDYAVVCSKDILLALKHTAHPTVKATLFRRRLAHSGEIPQSAELDEAQVKELTGGDRINARRMREDEWTFDPSHTLWLHANHRPKISGTDDGIWRRVKLIPFDVQIPEGRRDPKLANRIIKNESAGVLMWLLKGLAEYQRIGLATPDRVAVATNEYRVDSDTVAGFIADAGLIFDPALSIDTGTLTELHAEWFEAYGIGKKDKEHYQQVIATFKTRGVTSGRTSSRGRFWRGVGLLPQVEP